MALICNRHSFEYAENVCSSCGLPFCHDCLVYPRGPKKPPLCVQCAIAAAGVRSSARNHSNLSRREVKRRVREAKNMQQAQPHAEATPLANLPGDDHDFELTSNASFDQGWAVSWDEGRDPHPGYPEPVHVNWGSDPTAPAPRPAVAGEAPAPPPAAAPPMPAPRPAFVALTEPDVAPAARTVVPDDPEPPRAGLPRLQQVELPPGHAPARPGGLPSVRPPLKQPATDAPRTKLSATASQGPKLARPAAAAAPPGASAPTAPTAPTAPMPPQQPRVYGGAPATGADAPGPAAAPPAPAGRLRRNDDNESKDDNESSEMLGWLDNLIGTEKEQGPRT